VCLKVFDIVNVNGLEMVYYGTAWVTLTRPFSSWVISEPFPRNVFLYLSENHVDFNNSTATIPSVLEEVYSLALTLQILLRPIFDKYVIVN
jgi:hypothetical protein